MPRRLLLLPRMGGGGNLGGSHFFWYVLGMCASAQAVSDGRKKKEENIKYGRKVGIETCSSLAK